MAKKNETVLGAEAFDNLVKALGTEKKDFSIKNVKAYVKDFKKDLKQEKKVARAEAKAEKAEAKKAAAAEKKEAKKAKMKKAA